MRFTILASGSKGNACLVEAGDTTILIDNGLSYKELNRRMHLADRGDAQIQAVLVTHEHSDHVKGVGILARKLHIPVYISLETERRARRLFYGGEDIQHFSGPFQVGGLQIHPVSTSHDVVDPHGFVILDEHVKLGICTDLGFISTLVSERFRDLDALILEANHDTEMLKNGPYPWPLKQRVASRYGHLSNEQTATYLAERLSEKTQVVYLAHLSEENNRPELARDAVLSALAGGYTPRLEVASQYQPSETVEIRRRET